jgi:hypothetical protein
MFRLGKANANASGYLRAKTQLKQLVYGWGIDQKQTI